VCSPLCRKVAFRSAKVASDVVRGSSANR
jgi:hypothetical protein